MRDGDRYLIPELNMAANDAELRNIQRRMLKYFLSYPAKPIKDRLSKKIGGFHPKSISTTEEVE